MSFTSVQIVVYNKESNGRPLMVQNARQKLTGKEFRKQRLIHGQKFALNPKQRKQLRDAPLSDFFDLRLLERAGLGRSETQLYALGQSVNFMLQSLGLRTVGDIERTLSLDILAHVPGMGITSLAFLVDLLTLFGVTLTETAFEDSTIPQPRGQELADALGLPK